jgi:hypothetical protein
MDNVGYVAAGYLLTGGAILGFTLSLFARVRRARLRSEALSPRPGTNPAP